MKETKLIIYIPTFILSSHSCYLFREQKNTRPTKRHGVDILSVVLFSHERELVAVSHQRRNSVSIELQQWKCGIEKPSYEVQKMFQF